MTDIKIEESDDRIIISMDPGGPIALDDMTESFSALARYYERHFRTADELPPKLYVTRLESGSVIAEIAPYAMLLGSAIYTLDASIIVSDFSKRLRNGITAFSNPLRLARPPADRPRSPAEKMRKT